MHGVLPYLLYHQMTTLKSFLKFRVNKWRNLTMQWYIIKVNVVACTYKSSTWEKEQRGSQVWGQAELHRETMLVSKISPFKYAWLHVHIYVYINKISLLNLLKKNKLIWVVVARIFNPSTREIEATRSLNSRPV